MPEYILPTTVTSKSYSLGCQSRPNLKVMLRLPKKKKSTKCAGFVYFMFKLAPL